jgi:hypothetical protein
MEALEADDSLLVLSTTDDIVLELGWCLTRPPSKPLVPSIEDRAVFFLRKNVLMYVIEAMEGPFTCVGIAIFVNGLGIFKSKFEKFKNGFQKFKSRFRKFKSRFRKFKSRFQKFKSKFKNSKKGLENLETA